jgi:chromosome segregation protein
VIRVSKLTLRNFKSFKRVSLPIPEGFTAIVGPNGSGKSNIVDSLCFVLGRSSARSLRAERFSDLIFNGGKKDSPATQAEVTLVLDNRGKEIPFVDREIRISRSIDASGTSVYRLNGKRTTRTEILEILSAAKIQPDGHNIVLQGDITRIIEMSPVERRGLIDEIAGIAEYEGKKAKALRELGKVTENVTTAEAVLSEVREQTTKLAEERNNALRYQDLKRKIEETTASLVHAQYRGLEETIRRLEDELQEKEEREARIQRHRGILSIQEEVKRKESEEINQEIVLKEENEQFALFREMEKLKNEILHLAEKGEALEEERAKSLIRRGDLKKEMWEIREEIRRLTRDDEELRKGIDSLEARIRAVRGEIEAAYEKITDEDQVSEDQKERLRELRQGIDERGKELFLRTKEKAALEEKFSEKSRLLEAWERDRASKEEELRALEKELSEMEREKEGIEKRMEEGVHERLSLEEQWARSKEELGRLNGRIQGLSEELSVLRAEHQAREAIARGKTALEDSVRAILTLRDEKRIEGIYGTIGELGQVNPKYRRALTIAAGRGMNFLIVKDDQVAERCIRYLKEKGIGRATFLPLNTLRSTSPTPAEERIAGKAQGFCLDLVEFDPRFEKAFRRTFRNTVVVRDIPQARKLGIGKARMVTLEGDLLEKGGVMSGGSSPREGPGFRDGRATEEKIRKLEDAIAQLRKERDACLQKIEVLEEKAAELREEELAISRDREGLLERLRFSRQRIEEVKEGLAEDRVRSRKTASEVEEWKERIRRVEGEIASLSEEIEGMREERHALEEVLESSKAERIFREIQEKESQILALEKEKREAENQMGLNASQVGKILKPRFLALNQEFLEGVAHRKRLQEEVRSLVKKREELEATRSVLQEEEGEIQREIRSLKKRRDHLLRAVKAIGRKIASLEDERGGLKREIEALRIERVRHETRLEDLKPALARYGEPPGGGEALPDPERLEEEISRMETEMTSLEPVNMLAIEDYDEVKKRFEALEERVEKLLEEKRAILTLMEEIDRRKTAVFMGVFEEVAKNFRRIFSQLSTGGSADLFLDEEAPLEGGLHIQARPAGKNPQYIELMSGGEKTLTALAFIFAIQRYQPAPFYVLDEIDMFLDAENVKKVSELIKESSKEGQFIVVSLRDSLMASADHLFGVTNEDGVSKIVGVELEEVGRAAPG